MPTHKSIYRNIDNYQKALDYVNMTSRFDLTLYYQIMKYEVIGNIRLSQKDYAKAITNLEKGQVISEDSSKRNTPRQQAKRLIVLASAYRLSNQYDPAISTYQKAFTLLAPNFNLKDNIDQSNRILGKPDALKILEGQSKTLQNLFTQTKDITHLNEAYEIHQVATNLIRNMRQ